MYASHVEVQVQSGKTAEAIQLTKDLITQIGEIPKIKRFMLIDKGDDKALFIAFYDTAEDQVGCYAKSARGYWSISGSSCGPARKSSSGSCDRPHLLVIEGMGFSWP